MTNLENRCKLNDVGVDDAEGTPVPIPNTVVKLSGAENTWLATAWEDRGMPTFFIESILRFSIWILFFAFI